MSQAFVREGDAEWLHDVPPVLSALMNYLSKENNGIHIYDKENYIDPKTQKTVYVMSNGLSYTLDENSQWTIID
jgi:hypothetical protein